MRADDNGAGSTAQSLASAPAHEESMQAPDRIALMSIIFLQRLYSRQTGDSPQ
jgi:hypothetical protein